MIEGFERFNDYCMDEGVRSVPKVRISIHGKVFFNARITKALRGVSHSRLFYDKENKTILIQGCNENEPGTRRITRCGYEAASLSAKRFFNFFNIPLGEARSYTPAWDEETKSLLIKLGEED